MNQSVVITGASSGIGAATVAAMSRAGWQVFATVRKAADAKTVQAKYRGVRALIMDVRDEASIGAAAQEVESCLNGGLDGLVNVAGIGMIRPLEYASMDDIREIFETNVFGQIATVQAFAPLLRERPGRIVNITSVGVKTTLPFGGLLVSSKSAFGILSDTMRLELRPIIVSTIEPGAIVTPAVDKTLGDIDRIIEGLPNEAQRRYGAVLRKFARLTYKLEKNGSPPEVVARAIHHALTSSRPRIRYRVGKHAKLLATLPQFLPDWVLDEIRIRIFDLDSLSTAQRRKEVRPAAGHTGPAPA
jgi:NAD(P)-dependent dehydrogenase (short-subunit alcohol dehydrogenase family)